MNGRRCGLIAMAALWTPFVGGQSGEAATLDCSVCHSQPKTIAGTAHASVPCETCHPKHDILPHPSGIPKPACSQCHEEVAARYRLGIHGMARARRDEAAPDCTVCHGGVHEVRLTGTETFRKSVPEICGACHSDILEKYQQSVHGRAVARGIVAAPVCSSCHRAHLILAPASRGSSVFPSHIPETCGRCHGNVRLAEEFSLPRDALVSYDQSYHGLALREGRETVANCASCHGFHDILPPSDPRSSVNPRNLPKTCGKCHPGAGTQFAIGPVHFVAGQGEPAAVRWVRVAYRILIPLLVGAMLLHSLGDWVRKLFRLRLALPVDAIAAQHRPAHFRMHRFERIEHALLILSFAILAWTGFALKYPGAWWAWPLLVWELRFPVRGTVHRAAAVVFVALCVTHVLSLVTNRTLRQHWKTLWPQRSDVSQAILGLAYSLGLLRRLPPRSSHSYIEKIEYWALVWGAFVMSTTGAMLWANTIVMTWLPKTALDVATAIHFYEAVLATLSIAAWHFYSVIFDPDVYPMDPAWITGYSVREREPEVRGEDTQRDSTSDRDSSG
jgi:cytochrome b subunit of formate dehydrogenase